MSDRSKYNYDTYLKMALVLDKSDQCAVYWENCSTDWCAIAQMVHTDEDDEPNKLVERRTYGIGLFRCEDYCPYGLGVECIIRNSLWEVE